MRHLGWLMAGAALAAVPHAAVAQQPAPTGFAAEFWGLFDESMDKFIALAEAMPAEKYTWSPGEGVMTVAKVYGHVARYNYLYPATSLKTPAPDGRDKDAVESMTDKAKLVALLKESRTHVHDVVKGLSPGQAEETTLYGRKVAQWAVLFQLLGHMNEHLGQSIAYARMNGIVPPWSR